MLIPRVRRVNTPGVVAPSAQPRTTPHSPRPAEHGYQEGDMFVAV
jgi:hypothetical protein